MDLISLKQLSEEFNYTINTLRVYHSSRKIPMVKKFRCLFVTPETYKRLKYLYAMGAPFSQFYDKGGASLPLERNERGAVLPGLTLPKENQSNTSALIAELQKTIADQERQIELSERRERKALSEIEELKRKTGEPGRRTPAEREFYDKRDKEQAENRLKKEKEAEERKIFLATAPAKEKPEYTGREGFDEHLRLLDKYDEEQEKKEFARLFEERIREQNKPR